MADPEIAVRAGTGADSLQDTPLVSIGLPVFNGSRFLEQAIESLLGQTYRHLELVISDNASTDQTAGICRRYAELDQRVRYSRLDSNIGGIANHWRTVHLARGEFFMWASSDDLWSPEYVSRCVRVLAADKTAICAFAVNQRIDDRGLQLGVVESNRALDSESGLERFAEMTDIYRAIEPFYGVLRREELARLSVPRRHPGYDRILFAELSLLGKLVRIPDALYMRRIHGMQSVNMYPSLKSRYRWTDPTQSSHLIFPHVEYLILFLMAGLRRTKGASEKLGCVLHMLRWAYWHRHELWEDVLLRG